MTRFNRSLMRVVIAALAVAGFGAVSAAPLSGSVSSVGTICLGSTPMTPPSGECTHQDASTLTYLDFINGASPPMGFTPTPGSPGNLMFLAGSGDLMPLVGQTGQINDFTIPGPGDPLASFVAVDPLWTVTGADAATYSYVLSALTSIFRLNDHALDVRGTGSLCRNGADCNVFSFLFTTQDADGALRTTFSLSQSGIELKVPEPAALALLGLGLMTLAFGTRRRRAL